MFKNYLHDCKEDIYEVGDSVYYIDKKGKLRQGKVTRIRVEIDYETLQNVKKVRASYVNLDEIKKEIQDA